MQHDGYWVFSQVDPVAFSLGPLSVRWYGLMYLFGFAFAAHLNEKGTFTRATNGGGSKCIGRIEVAIGGHDGANSESDPPVEFTVSTMGTPPP